MGELQIGSMGTLCVVLTVHHGLRVWAKVHSNHPAVEQPGTLSRENEEAIPSLFLEWGSEKQRSSCQLLQGRGFCQAKRITQN